MNSIVKESLLFDFYGNMLTEKKQHVMRLYHEENLTLSEIAENAGISRAAVHDSLKKAERQLADFESKLGLVEKFIKTDDTVERAGGMIDHLLLEYGDDRELCEQLKKIRSLVADLAAL